MTLINSHSKRCATSDSATVDATWISVANGESSPVGVNDSDNPSNHATQFSSSTSRKMASRLSK